MPRRWPLALALFTLLVPGIGTAQQNVLPVPQPRLDDLEQAVAEQIRDAQ